MSGGSRFRFSLATVLKVARLREEAARLRLAQAEARVAASRQALEETRQLLGERLGDLKGDPVQEWAAADFLLRLHYLAHLSQAVAGWRERLAQEEAKREEERRILVEHHQQSRLLEKLREKAWRRHLRELQRRQEQETEALVLCRFPPEPEDDSSP